MFTSIVHHMRHVEASLSQMNAAAAFAFALACTERQWPVYQRITEVERPTGEAHSNLRQAIDAAWEHVARGTALAPALSTRCSGEVPKPESIVDASSSAAHTIANSIVDLLDAIEHREPAYPHHLSGRNLGLLELLADEFNEQNMEGSDEAKSVRGLIVQEIQEQNKDLQDLAANSSSSGIDAVRRRSVGRGLFGQIWFP